MLHVTKEITVTNIAIMFGSLFFLYMYILYQEVGTILLYRKIVSDMIK